MSFFKSKKVHLVYFAIILVFSVLPAIAGQRDFGLEFVLTIIIITLLCGGNFYFLYSFLIPKYFFTKRTFVFWILTLLFLIVYPLLWIGLLKLLWLTLQIKVAFLWDKLLSAFLYTLLFTTIGGFFRFMIEWFNIYQRKEELEKKNIENELALLRTQINPHFLFNTLNNIHTFTYIDADIAAYSIEKLADIMRYLLYESTSEKVPLEKEIKYIESYAELINLKYENKDFVEIKKQGDFSELSITPAILINFLENAFKHGKKRVSSPGIVINIEIISKELYFRVENYLSDSENTLNDENKGIGLKNVIRRLELIYQGKHSLKISINDKKFLAELKINFNEN